MVLWYVLSPLCPGVLSNQLSPVKIYRAYSVWQRWWIVVLPSALWCAVLGMLLVITPNF
jgi:hypothetical protein